MSDSRPFRVAALLLLAAGAAVAQTEDEESEDFVAEEIEEIIVYGERPGDPRRLEGVYEDPLRARILRELEELEILEEEYQWRQEKPAWRADSDSRIKWGYDPRDELRNRRDNELFDLPSEQNNRPATIFSVEF